MLLSIVFGPPVLSFALSGPFKQAVRMKLNPLIFGSVEDARCLGFPSSAFEVLALVCAPLSEATGCFTSSGEACWGEMTRRLLPVFDAAKFDVASPDIKMGMFLVRTHEKSISTYVCPLEVSMTHESTRTGPDEDDTFLTELEAQSLNGHKTVRPLIIPYFFWALTSSKTFVACEAASTEVSSTKDICKGFLDDGPSVN